MKFPNLDFTLKGDYKPWIVERSFQTELMWVMRWKWYIMFHPPDIWMTNKFLDVHLITPEGICHWLELKKIKWSTFNVKNFEDWQVFLLREMDKRNSELARVWIWSIKHNDYKILKFSDIWNNQNDKWWVKIFDK